LPRGDRDAALSIDRALIADLATLTTPRSKRTPVQPAHGKSMSEAYTIDGLDDEIAGIVVRYEGERGFRFHSALKAFDVLDGHVFVTPAAAQRAARDFAQKRPPRPRAPLLGGAA
jgi:hypothetical protein